MEYVSIPFLDMQVSRVALGTWAIGGWMWGGTDEDKAVKTIHAALDKGVNMIDTAPVYGFGRSEEIVGRAIKEYGGRDKLALVTKVGLDWYEEGTVVRNSTRERIRAEIEASLMRLGTDYIDLYLVHWPDPLVDFHDTADELKKLIDEGFIRAAGVSNYDPRQMELFAESCPLSTCQPPYNIFERGIEGDILPFCRERGIALMAYGALCRGLLTGKMDEHTTFDGDDLRKIDPKFQQPRYPEYLNAVDKLSRWAREKHGKHILELAVRYILDKGVDVALWGGRKPEQMDPLPGVFGWKLDEEDLQVVDDMVANSLRDPVGPEFMAPPSRDEVFSESRAPIRNAP